MPEPRPPPPCPICGKRPTVAQKPFCSDRCRQVDLGRWLSDAYVIPGDPIQDAAEVPED